VTTSPSYGNRDESQQTRPFFFKQLYFFAKRLATSAFIFYVGHFATDILNLISPKTRHLPELALVRRSSHRIVITFLATLLYNRLSYVDSENGLRLHLMEILNLYRICNEKSGAGLGRPLYRSYP
jgi:hypothetical protein